MGVINFNKDQSRDYLVGHAANISATNSGSATDLQQYQIARGREAYAQADAATPLNAATPPDAARLSNEQKVNQTGSNESANAAAPTDNSTDNSNSSPDNTASIPHEGTDGNQMASNNSSSKVSFSPILNPLNSYDQATYSIKFSALSDNIANKKEIIIAETGATNLTIQSLKMITLPGMNSDTRNTPSSSFEMRIFESYGTNLVDVMIGSAKALSVKNYMKGLWKISVKFQGFDPATGVANVSIVNRDWEWTVEMTTLNTKITESGSIHTIKFIMARQVAYFNHIALITEVININRTSKMTVGQVLKRCVEQMTANAVKKYNGNRFTYKIEQIPYTTPYAGIKSPFDHIIDPDNPQLNSTRNSDSITVGNISFMEFVDHVFSASKTAAQMALAASRDNDNNPKKNLEVISTFHMIDSKVSFGAYNSQINDYDKIITYIIRPYQTVRLITNVEQARDVGNLQKNLDKAKFLIQKKYLSKIYDYIFTGANTEVLKFDIDIDFTWGMAVQNNSGKTIYERETHGQVYNPRAVDESVNTDYKAPNSSSFSPSTLPTGNGAASLSNLSGGLGSAIGGLGGSLSSIPFIGSAINSARTAITAPLNNIIGQASNTVKQVSSKASAIINTTAFKDIANRNSLPEKINSPTNARLYADDIDFTKQNPFDLYPVTQTQQGNNTNGMNSRGYVEGEWTKQRSAYGMLLNQLYHGGGSQVHFNKIDMTIRGDPYWLGNDLSDKVSGSNQSAANYATFLKGDSVFILRFNLPQGFDEATGTVKLLENETYSGFYRCFQIEHMFQDGIFTQHLQASRIIGMEVSKLLKIS